jgi:hypothetical protein
MSNSEQQFFELAKTLAAEIVAHYSRDHGLHGMPWSSGELTLAEFEEWVASRKEAGRKIDTETCELGWWYADDVDPYGFLMAKGELPEGFVQIGRNRFVRSADSAGWISEDDLPIEKVRAMYARLGHRISDPDVDDEVPF